MQLGLTIFKEEFSMKLPALFMTWISQRVVYGKGKTNKSDKQNKGSVCLGARYAFAVLASVKRCGLAHCLPQGGDDDQASQRAGAHHHLQTRAPSPDVSRSPGVHGDGQLPFDFTCHTWTSCASPDPHPRHFSPGEIDENLDEISDQYR